MKLSRAIRDTRISSGRCCFSSSVLCFSVCVCVSSEIFALEENAPVALGLMQFHDFVVDFCILVVGLLMTV